MLTLKSSAYSPEELDELHRVLDAAHALVKCDRANGCHQCKHRHVCRDLDAICDHIADLQDQHTRKTRDSDES